MSYIIVQWATAADAAIITDSEGNNLEFEFKSTAEDYAKENCAWNWKVIDTLL